jgi:hypothetical protein
MAILPAALKKHCSYAGTIFFFEPAQQRTLPDPQLSRCVERCGDEKG